MAGSSHDHIMNTTSVGIHEDGSNNELDFYYTGYHISSRTASSLPELLQAPSNGYNLLAPVSVIDYVPTLDYGSSVFPHQAQQDLSHTVFDVSRGAWSDTTLRPGMHGQESSMFHEVPRLMNRGVPTNIWDNDYRVAHDHHGAFNTGQYNIDHALQGVSSGLVTPQLPYPQTILEADLPPTSTSPQQQPNFGQRSISPSYANAAPVLQPTDTHNHRSDQTSDGHPDDSDTVIGSFHHNGRFKCLQQSCVRKSFKRQAELRRHYDTIHAVQKPEYWCQVATCHRSQVNGDHPFPRRDNMTDHMRKVHGRS